MTNSCKNWAIIFWWLTYPAERRDTAHRHLRLRLSKELCTVSLSVGDRSFSWILKSLEWQRDVDDYKHGIKWYTSVTVCNLLKRKAKELKIFLTFFVFSSPETTRRTRTPNHLQMNPRSSLISTWHGQSFLNKWFYALFSKRSSSSFCFVEILAPVASRFLSVVRHAEMAARQVAVEFGSFQAVSDQINNLISQNITTFWFLKP